MIYRFGPFELDLQKAEFRKHRQPRPVEPQVFGLLAYLVEHRWNRSGCVSVPVAGAQVGPRFLS